MVEEVCERRGVGSGDEFVGEKEYEGLSRWWEGECDG